ncbi:MAG: hypothetical protein V3U86_02020 [Acidobacteriota bacterium]
MRRWQVGALLVWLVMPVAAASTEAELGNMQCVEVSIEQVGDEAQSVGLNENTLSDWVVLATKAKLPRLKIKETCPDVLLVHLNFLLGTYTDRQPAGQYSGSVELSVLRRVTVEATGKHSFLPVWYYSAIVFGPTKTAKKTVLNALEQLGGRFAADYYKAGNE